MNVDRIPVEEHLVMARKFVLEWMNRRNPPQERSVIRILARIDLHTRRRWWRHYVQSNGPSITPLPYTRATKADRLGIQTPDGSHTQAPRKEAGKVKGKKVRAKERAEAKALKELAGQT